MNYVTSVVKKNRGYNRFLTMSGDATIKIDYDKVARDERLDGYKMGLNTLGVLQLSSTTKGSRPEI